MRLELQLLVNVHAQILFDGHIPRKRDESRTHHLVRQRPREYESGRVFYPHQ
jgi:hypothetical protein